MASYQRTGAQTPEQFLARYYDSAANGGQGSFIYPPANGFVIDSAGAPVETAPWFDQPGSGEQYQLDGSLLPGGPARLYQTG